MCISKSYSRGDTFRQLPIAFAELAIAFAEFQMAIAFAKSQISNGNCVCANFKWQLAIDISNRG